MITRALQATFARALIFLLFVPWVVYGADHAEDLSHAAMDSIERDIIDFVLHSVSDQPFDDEQNTTPVLAVIVEAREHRLKHIQDDMLGSRHFRETLEMEGVRPWYTYRTTQLPRLLEAVEKDVAPRESVRTKLEVISRMEQYDVTWYAGGTVARIRPAHLRDSPDPLAATVHPESKRALTAKEVMEECLLRNGLIGGRSWPIDKLVECLVTEKSFASERTVFDPATLEQPVVADLLAAALSFLGESRGRTLFFQVTIHPGVVGRQAPSNPRTESEEPYVSWNIHAWTEEWMFTDQWDEPSGPAFWAERRRNQRESIRQDDGE